MAGPCVICNAPIPEDELVYIRFPSDLADRPEYRGQAHQKCYEIASKAPHPENRPLLLD
jgi:hypothetical protein